MKNAKVKLLYVEYSGDTEPVSAWIEIGGGDFEYYIKSPKKADRLMAAGRLIDTGIWSGETWASLLRNPETKKFGRSFSGDGRYEVYEIAGKGV